MIPNQEDKKDHDDERRTHEKRTADIVDSGLNKIRRAEKVRPKRDALAL